jgi:HAD superfamily hydrolase (TIGR01490 family)
LRRAAFFDLDGTLTSANVWRGFMAYFTVYNKKRWTYMLFMLTHLPLFLLKRVGLISEVEFRTPWAAHMAWFVRGMNREEADHIWNWVAESFLDANNHWRSDSCRLVGHHLAEEDIVVLVSSGPEPLIERLADSMGVCHAVGTRLEVAPTGKYTGKSVPPVCIDQHKVTLARRHLDDLGLVIDYRASFAYADSITDLSLLEMVGHPVAVYPEPALRSLAQKRGWEIFEMPQFTR